MTTTARRPRELVTVSVAGMTCAACERRIAKALTALPGVISATASTRKGTASLIATSQASRASIDKTISDLGYGLGRSPWLNRDPQIWRSAGVAAVFVAVLVWVVGAGDLTGRLGDLSTGGLLLVLALGLAAGVSTCMAMVGGIVLAISASAAGRSAAKGAEARASVWQTNLAFQAGRIVGFGLLGAALGALGANASMPQPVVVVLMVAVAVAMLLIGVRLTELSPRIAGWSPTSAGAIMATFAIGTAPALFAVAGAPTLFKGTKKIAMLRTLGVVVVGFAFVNATSAMRLAGVDFTAGTRPPQSVSANVGLTLTDQTITSTQDGDGYHPDNAVIYAGRPTHWVMTSTAPFTCASTVVSKDLGVQTTLQAGRNVIELPRLSAGTYNYSCGMGMYSGRIVVIQPPVATAS